jgi:hypothetical protein
MKSLGKTGIFGSLVISLLIWPSPLSAISILGTDTEFIGYQKLDKNFGIVGFVWQFQSSDVLEGNVTITLESPDERSIARIEFGGIFHQSIYIGGELRGDCVRNLTGAKPVLTSSRLKKSSKAVVFSSVRVSDSDKIGAQYSTLSATISKISATRTISAIPFQDKTINRPRGGFSIVIPAGKRSAARVLPVGRWATSVNDNGKTALKVSTMTSLTLTCL